VEEEKEEKEKEEEEELGQRWSLPLSWWRPPGTGLS
jgi:hypothetical protein